MHRNEVIDLRNYRGEDGETTGNEAEVSGDELPPGTTILHGQYKITGYLNSGGFGITYRARDSLGREVVIKECFPGVMCFRAGLEVRVRSKSHTDEFSSMVKSFVKEAHALAAMDHKNIVKVHQVFEENETAYMAIDYIDGLDLLAVIEEQSDRLGPPEIERLARKTLRAINYIHDRGMLHRDISPDNILLDADDEPILIDFGSAREKAKKTGRVMSRMKFVKDGYSPQEFYVEGSEQGPWSDLYSFAASLYHLIDGTPPEDGQKRMSALAQREPDPYQPLHGRMKGFSRGFLQTIDKALQVAPVNRFQSADEWLDALSPLSERRQPRVTSRERSQPLPSAPAEPRSSAPVTTIPRPAGTSASQKEHPGSAAKIRKSLPVTTEPSANDASLAPAERSVRNSLKGELAEERSKSPLVLIGIASAATLSVVGIAALFVFGGGTQGDVATAVETAAVPAPATTTSPQNQPEAVAPAAIATRPAEPVTPVAPAALPASEPDAPMEFAPEAVATRALPTDTRPDPAIDAADPRSAAIVPAPRVQVETPLTGISPQERPADLVVLQEPAPRIDALPPASAGAVDIPRLAPDALAPQISENAPAVFDLGIGPMPQVTLADTGIDTASFPTFAAPQTPAASETLPSIETGTAPVVHVAAPAPLPQPAARAPLVARQVQSSHWDVEMPFTAALERVRNANTATIAEVSSNADLAVSGAWIEEGVKIYTFNGEKLMPDTPLSVHVLMSMNIDPDGFARATVRYQPEGGQIDRGLLAVPIVRKLSLADGTELVGRANEGGWVFSVVSFGDSTESTLRVGDLLKQEITTGIELSGHEELERALDLLVERGAATAEFNVLRGGALVKASHTLARKRATSARGG